MLITLRRQNEKNVFSFHELYKLQKTQHFHNVIKSMAINSTLRLLLNASPQNTNSNPAPCSVIRWLFRGKVQTNKTKLFLSVRQNKQSHSARVYLFCGHQSTYALIFQLCESLRKAAIAIICDRSWSRTKNESTNCLTSRETRSVNFHPCI